MEPKSYWNSLRKLAHLASIDVTTLLLITTVDRKPTSLDQQTFYALIPFRTKEVLALNQDKNSKKRNLDPNCNNLSTM